MLINVAKNAFFWPIFSQVNKLIWHSLVSADLREIQRLVPPVKKAIPLRGHVCPPLPGRLQLWRRPDHVGKASQPPPPPSSPMSS